MISQRGVHESHQTGHHEATVSRWYIDIFRKAFERAGITQEMIHFLETNSENISAHLK